MIDCRWCTSGLMVLGVVRKQAKQAKGKTGEKRFPMASIQFLPCLSSCIDFLQLWTVMWKCKQINTSLLKLLVVMASQH